jgi:hypothetical protein
MNFISNHRVMTKFFIGLFCLVVYTNILCKYSDKEASNSVVYQEKNDTKPSDSSKSKPKGNSLDYLYARKYSEILGLENLESGVDSIEIRLWFDYSFIDTCQLISIKYENLKWQAKLTTFSFSRQQGVHSVVLKQKVDKSVTPKNGWDHFIEEINRYRILTNRSQNELVGFLTHTDGDGLCIEFATRSKYRIYSYQLLGDNINRFEEIRNIEAIINLMITEFNFRPLKRIVSNSK